MCKSCRIREATRKTGQCNSCYRKDIRLAGGCSIEGCLGGPIAKGYCSKHYQRISKGLPLDFEKEIGKTYISDGYIVEYRPGHIQAYADGKVMQHRRIMADILGRRLFSFENVHHKDGNRRNNSVDNLELWVSKQPVGQRPEDLVAWAKEILSLYEGSGD